MNISELSLTNFRCFTEYRITSKAPVVLIEGANGSGKTSLLEALHFACSLRSFRTHAPKEMIHFNAQAFTLSLTGSTRDELWNVYIGCSPRKRLIKINEAQTSSYKDIIALYRIVSILENDLAFITGSPEFRRSIIDNALLVASPEVAILYKKYRAQLEQRNALLQSPQRDHAVWDVWTEQLWNTASLLTRKRIALLDLLTQKTQELHTALNLKHSLTITYVTKTKLHESYDEFKEQEERLFAQEYILQRTLFGPHLDDISIYLHERSSRIYASRGQQKLILFLFKLAQCVLHEKQTILLLDDLFTDFDTEILKKLVPLALSVTQQTFITSPTHNALLEDLIKEHQPYYQRIIL